jgi:hypothetical protein
MPEAEEKVNYQVGYKEESMLLKPQNKFKKKLTKS